MFIATTDIYLAIKFYRRFIIRLTKKFKTLYDLQKDLKLNVLQQHG